MEDRHSFSEPRPNKSSTDPSKPSWLVDIFRKGVDDPIDTIMISEDTLPPRKKKGKIVWRLPSDYSRLPSFAVDERRRIMEMFKERKKNRRKKANKVVSANETTSVSSSSVSSGRGKENKVSDSSSCAASNAITSSFREEDNIDISNQGGHDAKIRTNFQNLTINDRAHEQGPVADIDLEKNNSRPSSTISLPESSMVLSNREKKTKKSIQQLKQQLQQQQQQQQLEPGSKATLPLHHENGASLLQEDKLVTNPANLSSCNTNSDLHTSRVLPKPPGFNSSFSEKSSGDNPTSQTLQKRLHSTDSVIGINSEAKPPDKNISNDTTFPQTIHPQLPLLHGAKCITVTQRDLEILTPTSSLVIAAAKKFVDIYYPYVTLSMSSELVNYFTSCAQKSISVGGAHSVVATRAEIMLQLSSLSRSKFFVRGIVSQDAYGTGGAHVLVTGVVITSGVTSQFAHSVSLVPVTNARESNNGIYGFQIHNDALSLITNDGFTHNEEPSPVDSDQGQDVHPSGHQSGGSTVEGLDRNISRPPGMGF